MSGIRGDKALSLPTGLSLLSLAETIEKTPSAADRAFQVDSDRFLFQERRVRRDAGPAFLRH